MCDTVCDIAGGEVCSTGVCTPTGCAAGLTDCGGGCVDITTNPSHCGGCNVVCAGGQVCDGACTTACGAGKTSCNGACVDLMASPQHCGECGTSCSDQSVCTFDQCTMGECSNISGAISCDDNNPCTNEQCDPATGCPADPNDFTLTPAEIQGLCSQTQTPTTANPCWYCDPAGDQCNEVEEGTACNLMAQLAIENVGEEVSEYRPHLFDCLDFGRIEVQVLDSYVLSSRATFWLR